MKNLHKEDWSRPIYKKVVKILNVDYHRTIPRVIVFAMEEAYVAGFKAGKKSASPKK